MRSLLPARSLSSVVEDQGPLWLTRFTAQLDRGRCGLPNHGCPWSNPPMCHESISDKRICGCKPFRNIRRVSLKQQHRTIDRVGQCSSEDELTPATSLPAQIQVLFPEFDSAFQVVCNHFIEQKVVHDDAFHRMPQQRRAASAAGSGWASKKCTHQVWRAPLQAHRQTPSRCAGPYAHENRLTSPVQP